MRLSLFIVIVFYNMCLFAQVVEEHGMDSVTGREWIVNSSFTPSGASCLVRKEYVSDEKQQFIFLNCSDSSELQHGPWGIPEECRLEYKRNKAAGMNIDSAYRLLRACSDICYKTAKNGYKSDTIYINSRFFMEPYKNEKDCYFAYRIEIYDSLKHFRYATYFYGTEALKNKCLSGNNFRIEHRESWKDDKEDGEWVYYDPYGRELLRVTYEEGKRVK
jgi:hypothetical protein